MIILGPPASGKTGLALRLAAELSRPVLCKDDVKEALFDVLGSTDREGSRRFSEAALAAVLRMARTQLCAGSCCLIEGNFTRNHAAALREILGASQASAAQILCSAPLPELERRFAARSGTRAISTRPYRPMTSGGWPSSSRPSSIWPGAGGCTSRPTRPPIRRSYAI